MQQKALSGACAQFMNLCYHQQDWRSDYVKNILLKHGFASFQTSTLVDGSIDVLMVSENSWQKELVSC